MRSSARPFGQWLASPPAGFRVLALLAASTATFLISDCRVLAAILVGVILCFPLARVAPGKAGGQIRPILLLVVIVCGLQFFLAGPLLAAIATLRCLAVILLASLVTLTTPSSALIASLERALTPVRLVGIDPAKVGLALSMTLRFLPLIARITEEVREAQRCRRLERSFVAVAVPTILRMLKIADDISAAIDARSGELAEEPKVTIPALSPAFVRDSPVVLGVTHKSRPNPTNS